MVGLFKHYRHRQRLQRLKQCVFWVWTDFWGELIKVVSTYSHEVILHNVLNLVSMHETWMSKHCQRWVQGGMAEGRRWGLGKWAGLNWYFTQLEDQCLCISVSSKALHLTLLKQIKAMQYGFCRLNMPEYFCSVCATFLPIIEIF